MSWLLGLKKYLLGGLFGLIALLTAALSISGSRRKAHKAERERLEKQVQKHRDFMQRQKPQIEEQVESRRANILREIEAAKAENRPVDIELARDPNKLRDRLH
jgi:hypothetical protein